MSCVPFILDEVACVNHHLDITSFRVVNYPTAESVKICWMTLGEVLSIRYPDNRKLASSPASLGSATVWALASVNALQCWTLAWINSIATTAILRNVRIFAKLFISRSQTLVYVFISRKLIKRHRCA